MGRRKKTYGCRIKIDWAEVDKLLEVQCNGLMIASALGINEETLYDRTKREKNMSWSDYAAQGKAKGAKKLLQRQWTRALNGTGADKMLIHLGEKYIEEQKKTVDPAQASVINLHVHDLPF